MSLQNLVTIGQLQTHEPHPGGIAKLLQAARRNLADAGIPQVSSDNRFVEYVENWIRTHRPDLLPPP